MASGEAPLAGRPRVGDSGLEGPMAAAAAGLYCRAAWYCCCEAEPARNRPCRPCGGKIQARRGGGLVGE